MTLTSTMSADAKRALSKTIRGLRETLLSRLSDATEATYRLSIEKLAEAGLDEVHRVRRARLEAWLDEQLRAEPAAPKKSRRTRADFLKTLQKDAASTLLNRVVLLRLMEAPGPDGPLRKPAVVTGGWKSEGYDLFRDFAPELVKSHPGVVDDGEGYPYLLSLVFEDLAQELPGLFGPAGAADLIPVPVAALRAVVEGLDAPELASCWTDDMTLGWVYQYWNDPEREALDEKLNARGKLEGHEIASKTQMFTERYMVDWLLQNSLGPQWFAICAKHGWTPEALSLGLVDGLETRRVEWRQRREAGEVELTELMPLMSDAERRWAYWVPPGEGSGEDLVPRASPFGLPAEAVEAAPDSLRTLKLIDPAVGSGHFLVVALELLFHLYLEEARHRGEEGVSEWQPKAVVEHILAHNVHGVDLDPRAVQIAAAALWLKGQTLARGAEPQTLNLVASKLRLGALPEDDPALAELKQSVGRETGMPGSLVDQLLVALRGADHLGSLLKVDAAVEAAIAAHERAGGLGQYAPGQMSLLEGPAQMAFDAAGARQSLLEGLDRFLAQHTRGDDLGLRLRGEQLAAGVRFVRLVREGTYDLVVANPPYQGTSKMADAKYVAKEYALGKADLFAAFLMRGLALAREGGVSAMLTMRNWMFIKQYAKLREHLLASYDLRALHDLSSGAFEEISPAQVVVNVTSSIFARQPGDGAATALKVFDDSNVTQQGETTRKRAATLCHIGRHTFDPAALKVVPEWPLVYWWDDSRITDYAAYPKLSELAPAKLGANLGDNTRFLRRPWELAACGFARFTPELRHHGA